MRKILIILFLFCATLLQAQTTYYVVASGGDDGETGVDSTTHAWATIAHAVATVSAEDTVWLCSGTHAVSSRITVPVGVNIKGNGESSIISSSITTTYYATIYLHSTTEGTDGNQSISYIKMDGNETAWGAIQINARSNVSIHHCTFIDFFSCGTIFNGSTAYYGPPTSYATGNEYHDNISTNCSDYPLADDGQGHVMFGGQTGIEIYNNTMTQTSRDTRRNGYLIKFYSYGYSQGFKIYDNVFTRSEDGPAGVYYDFSIELWHTQGGAEIYGNTMTGGIDVGGGITYSCLTKGDYDFGIWIHNNTIGGNVISTGETGIYLERKTNGAIIEKNWFKNLYNGIMIDPHTDEYCRNHRISYNIFNETRYYGIRFINGYTGAYVDSINIYNNVFYCASGTSSLVGVGMLSVGTTTNLNIINNIIQGYDYAPMFANGASGQTIDKLNIKNNIIYGNGNSNVPLFSSLTPTNYTNSDNVIDDPDFTTPGTDFTLQVGSPAIDAGLGVGLNTDYLGNVVGDLPDIGAYEYDSEPPEPPGLPTVNTYFQGINALATAINASGVGGVLVNDGGGTVSEIGIVWSESINPTISDKIKIWHGPVDDNFTITLSGLHGGTAYHIRAFATNESGTAYGADSKFITPEQSIVIYEGKTLNYDNKILIAK